MNSSEGVKTVQASRLSFTVKGITSRVCPSIFTAGIVADLVTIIHFQFAIDAAVFPERCDFGNLIALELSWTAELLIWLNH